MNNNPSGFFHRLVSETEMLRLFNEHEMEQKISQYTPEERIVDQGAMHHAFCCTIKVFEYFETDSCIQVATFHVQIYAAPGKPSTRTVRMFRDGLNVYILEPPSP